MGANVGSSNIGDEPLEAVLLTVEHKGALCFLIPISIPLGSKEQTKLQGHVEPRQGRVPIHLSSRDVVNAVSALLNDGLDLGEPVFRRVVSL
jgi:hypothetical protein